MSKKTYGIVNGKNCLILDDIALKKNNSKKTNIDKKKDELSDISISRIVEKQKSLLVDDSEQDDNSEESQKYDEGEEKQKDASASRTKKQKYKTKKSIRLTDDNKKPTNPASFYVSANDLKEELKYYDRVPTNELKSLAVGTRVKYVEVIETLTEDGDIIRNFKLKPGGVIIVNGGEYLVLASGNRKTWSVQLSRHIIFLERFERVRDEYEKRIKEYEYDIKVKMESNKNLKDETIRLKKEIKLLKKTVKMNENK